jgi:hypothetical protein
MSTLDKVTPSQDSNATTRLVFDKYFEKEISYNSSEVNAVIGFFTKRGFEELAAISISSVLLEQAKKDKVNVYELLDTLTGLDKVKLSALVSALLNSNRSALSKIGYRSSPNTNNLEARNILY